MTTESLREQIRGYVWRAMTNAVDEVDSVGGFDLPLSGDDIRDATEPYLSAAVTAIEALIGSEVAQAGERRDLLVDRDTDTAKHPFVPSALNASFCMRCGETATWHPHNIRPPSRVCRGCGHQWPHGGVFVFAGNEGREEWAGNFCEVCELLDLRGAAMTPEEREGERE